jgi:transcription initiation factor TFIID subunit 6
MQQPPHKKIATEGTMGVIPMNSMQTDRQGAAGGYSTVVGFSNVGLSSMSRQLPTENMFGREVGGRVVKASTVVSQAWKENMDAGHLLASSFEFFGESLYSFAPKPELSSL